MSKLIYCLAFLVFLWMGCYHCVYEDCGNGNCDKGICVCLAGYEKDASGKCTIEERAKFLGTWTGKLNGIDISLVISITSEEKLEEVEIKGIYYCISQSSSFLPLIANINGNSITSINTATCSNGLIHEFSDVNINMNGDTMHIAFKCTKIIQPHVMGVDVLSGTLSK